MRATLRWVMCLVLAWGAAATPLAAQEAEEIDDWDDVIAISVSKLMPTGDLSAESLLGPGTQPPAGLQFTAAGSVYFAVPGGAASLAPPATADFWFPEDWAYFAGDGFVVHAFQIEGWDPSLVYAEAAVFTFDDEQAGLVERPEIPNDPGTGAAEVSSLVWAGGEPSPVWGRSESGELGLYVSPHPYIAGETGDIRLVLVVTPDPSNEFSSVLSWARDAAGPGSVGFIRKERTTIDIGQPVTNVAETIEPVTITPLTDTVASIDQDQGADEEQDQGTDEEVVESASDGTETASPVTDNAQVGQPSQSGADDREDQPSEQDADESLTEAAAGLPPSNATRNAVIAGIILLGAILGVRLWRGNSPATEGVTYLTTEPPDPLPGTIPFISTRLGEAIDDARWLKNPVVDEWQLLDFESASELMPESDLKRFLPDDVPWNDSYVGLWTKGSEIRVGSQTDPYAYVDATGRSVPGHVRDAARNREGTPTFGGDEDDVMP